LAGGGGVKKNYDRKQNTFAPLVWNFGLAGSVCEREGSKHELKKEKKWV
jgi:hypothetical protein